MATGGRLGSAEEIIRRHTILPYYLPFSDRISEAESIARLAGTSIGSLKYQLGILTSRFRANHPLKACPACMESDRRQWATTYWHLQHQLPGTWICLKHNELLTVSTLKSTGVSRFQWLLPTAAAQDAAPCESYDKDALTRLATLASALWYLPVGTRLHPQFVAATYRQTLRDRGLVTGNGAGRLCHTEIGAKYSDYLEPLRKVQELRALPHSPVTAAQEVRRLASTPRSGVHPLRHLALIGWLYGDMNGLMKELSKTGFAIAESIEGPKEKKSDDARHQIRQQLIERVISGRAVSTVSRELGIDPKTGMAWLAAHGLETKKRPSLITGKVRIQMMDALRRGLSKQEVATKGKVSVVSVTRLLDTEVGLREAWMSAKFNKAQHHARSSWQKLMVANPQAGVKAIRLIRPDIYMWLYRNDREWLVAKSQEAPPMRPVSGRRVDWLNRDKALATKITEVALDLSKKTPKRKVKLWQLYQRIPDLKAKLGHLDQLPLSQAAIRDALNADVSGGDLLE